MNLEDVIFTHHFYKQAREKGFTAEQIAGAIVHPDKITKVTKHAGQTRHCGSGIAVVMCGMVAITVYEDEVITPLRPDQMNDPDALNSKRLND